MFDDFSKRSKAVRTAFDLAKERSWGDIRLTDIAQAANLDLSDLRREFSCKSDIIRAFQKEVDAEVLSRARPAGEAQSPRDRLFDVIMTRFEVMQPYKQALKRISSYLCCRPGEAAPLLCGSLVSQYWMLAGSGAKLDGPARPAAGQGRARSVRHQDRLRRCLPRRLRVPAARLDTR